MGVLLVPSASANVLAPVVKSPQNGAISVLRLAILGTRYGQSGAPPGPKCFRKCACSRREITPKWAIFSAQNGHSGHQIWPIWGLSWTQGASGNVLAPVVKSPQNGVISVLRLAIFSMYLGALGAAQSSSGTCSEWPI